MNNFSFTKGSPEEAHTLCGQIPEFENLYPLPEFQQRLSVAGALVLAAYAGSHPAGVIAGYPAEGEVFYVWMMGVLPEFRKQGTGKHLLEAIIFQIQNSPYKQIIIKTRNRHKAMICLLPGFGFDIYELEKRENVPDYRILFKKNLAAMSG